jgi:two-component sensor histidine kinase
MRVVRERLGGRRPAALDVEIAGVFQLAGLRHELGRLARERGFAPDREAGLMIAVDEVVGQALDRDAGPVRVRWCSGHDAVRIRIDANGGLPWASPGTDTGGGLRVAAELAQVTVLHSTLGTTVRLGFPVDGGGGAG